MYSESETVDNDISAFDEIFFIQFVFNNMMKPKKKLGLGKEFCAMNTESEIPRHGRQRQRQNNFFVFKLKN